MTTATLTDAATVTLAFPLAAAEGLRHAITLAIHERPTSERDMLASIYGALVNPQPPRAAPRPEAERRDGMRGLRGVDGRAAPVDVLAVMDRAAESAGEIVKASNGDFRAVIYQDDLFKARAAIAELIEATPALLALYRIKWGNLDPDANSVLDAFERAFARVGGGK